MYLPKLEISSLPDQISVLLAVYAYLFTVLAAIIIVVVSALQKLIKFLVTNRLTTNFRLDLQTPAFDLHKRRLVRQKEQQQQICILFNTHLFSGANHMENVPQNTNAFTVQFVRKHFRRPFDQWSRAIILYPAQIIIINFATKLVTPGGKLEGPIKYLYK